MISLRDASSVVGVGETAYTRGSPHSHLRLQLEASLAACADAGLPPHQIDGVIPVGITAGTAEDYVANLGIADLKFSAVVPHGGASGVGALQLATAAVSSGLCDHVLVAFGRNTTSGLKAFDRIHTMAQFRLVTEFELPQGAAAPVQLYAAMARRHMELYGTTSLQLAEVAMSTREHAQRHPNAVMRKPMTLQDHQTSRLIADPFRLLDCSLETDGGAAFVVSRTEAAVDLRQPVVRILGTGMGHPHSPGVITQRDDLTRFGIARAAGPAFGRAGVSRQDIDVAEIYDCFTYVVLCQLEDLGFCAKGEGGPFVQDGCLRLGGALPTNTHGGLLSQAHVYGLNHVVELVRQLRGQAGSRQVAGAEIGLVTGYGDMGDGGLAILGAGAA